MTQYNDLLITIALVLFIITALFAIAKMINIYVHNWLCDWHQENTAPKFVALHERVDRFQSYVEDELSDMHELLSVPNELPDQQG